MGLGWESWLFLFATLNSTTLFFVTLYSVVKLSDFECRYIPPRTLCSIMNICFVVELLSHSFLTVLFLVSGQYVAALLNAPLFLYNYHKSREPTDFVAGSKIRTTEKGVVPDEVLQTLSGHKQEGFCKLGLFLFAFFYYIYRIMLVMVQGSESTRVFVQLVD